MRSPSEGGLRIFHVLVFACIATLVGCADAQRQDYYSSRSGPINPWAPDHSNRDESDPAPEAGPSAPVDPAPVGRCYFSLGDRFATEGTLTVSFATKTVGGLYGPRNVGAVWIEGAELTYVRTLEVWAMERQMSVVQWYNRACHVVADGGVDAVATATLPEPATHKLQWDGRDRRGKPVPDGVYTLWMQVSENEIFPGGPFQQIPFSKGPVGQVITIPAADERVSRISRMARRR